MIIDSLKEISAVPTPALGLLPAIHDAEVDKISNIHGAFLAAALAGEINKGTIATAVANKMDIVVTGVALGSLVISATSSRVGGVSVVSEQSGGVALRQISKITIQGVPSEGDLYTVLIGGNSYSVTAEEFIFPEASLSKNMVFLNDTVHPVVLPSTDKWPARNLSPGEICGSDGRLFYKVTNKAGTTSYYPSHFERGIYTFSFNKETFPIGETFSFERFFYFRLIGNNCTTVWSVIFEIGERIYQTAPTVSHAVVAVLTSGQKTIQVSVLDAQKLSYMVVVTGNGIPGGLGGTTYVESIDSLTGIVTLTQAATLTGTQNLIFKTPIGPNLASWRWLPPLLEQEIVMTDVKSMNPLGIWIKNWGEKQKQLPDGSIILDPYRNDYGFEGYAKLFSGAQPVRMESLPSSAEFLLRLRIGQFDTENGVPDPIGYAAYLVRSDDEDAAQADSA
jgi:hypothetical protein